MIVFLPDCSSTASAVESATTRSSGWRKYWFSRSSSNSSNSSNFTQDEQDPSSEDDFDSETPAAPVPPARTTMSKLRRRASHSATQFKKELQSCAIHPCANITFSTRDRFTVALEARFLLASAFKAGPTIGHDNFYMSFQGVSTNAAQLDSAPLLGWMHSMTMPGRHDEPKWNFAGGQQEWGPSGLADSEKMDKSWSAGQGVMANLVFSDESLGNRLAVRATYIADDDQEDEPCSRQTNQDRHGLSVSCAGDYTVVDQGCRIYKLKMRRTVQIVTAASDKKPLVQLRQGLVRKVWINHSLADHVERRVSCWPPCAVPHTQSLEGAARGGHGRAGDRSSRPPHLQGAGVFKDLKRWQWQVVEAVYAAAQGEKLKAEAKLHRMELLFRKTGHVAAEIAATGCRGLVQASAAMNEGEMSAARQLLMRSVYLAHEQPQEEVAAAVADRCALKLSWDMATGLHNRLAMQLDAARVRAHAGDLLTAEEAVLEALDVFLVPPKKQAASASEAMSMLWGSSAAAQSSRFGVLASAAWLVETLWPREQRHEHLHGKLKAALEAVREHCCGALANNVDYLKEEPIVRFMLMLLVDVYQDDREWAAAERLLDALAPQLKDSRDFRRRVSRQLRHTRHYREAARVFEDLVTSSSKVPRYTDSTSSASEDARLLLLSAYDYMRAGQHQSAATILNRLELMIRATTSWPPPGPGTDYVDPKQHLEFELCIARARIAMGTKRPRYDQAVVGLQQAASLQKAIINDIQHRQLPVAKRLVRELMIALTLEAHVHFELNKDDVKSHEARIEGIQTLDPDAGTVCELRVRLLLAKGDAYVEEAAESMRELFLLMAERQEGRGGGDDDRWITDYDQGGHCMSLAMLVDSLELTHVGLGRHDKALLWAERGRMRLFMHRVQAQQQHREDDPQSAVDSTLLNDFDRDDEKALDMLAKVLLACGPNVALLEYSIVSDYVVSEDHLHPYERRGTKLRVYAMFRMSDLKLVAGFESFSSSRIGFWSKTLYCPAGIEQLVKDARDSIIIARPQQKGEAGAATNKKRHTQQQLRYLAQLHNLLVAPVLKELADHCDTLILVPDGILSLVPFAALYDESAGQFLIQQKQVVVAPCLRALYRCLDLQDRFFSAPSTLQQPFVAGNPCPMGLGLHQLPHAQEEAAAVADILGVKPCLGAAVTKEAVVEALCHSSVVVLASHAIVGPKFPAGALVLQGPSLSHDPDMASSSRASTSTSTSAASNYDLALLRAIMMDPDSDEPETTLLMRGLQASVTDKSQVLTADELSGMRIPAGLVVLSACETGRGEVTPEGVLGMGRALLQAGATTTVLSLWKVDDQATKRLITEMFQELQKGEPVGTALRKAMLKMIQEGSSISHWAPFFIFGSPTMHLRNVTTLKAKNKMNGSSPELELGDGMQQVERPTSDATRSAASSADDQAAVQAVLVGSHESAWMDSSTGAICRRLFARGIHVWWGTVDKYWTWRTSSLNSSTNSNEVAVLKQVCWLDLRGRIKGALTPGTVYTLSWRLAFAPFSEGFNQAEHPVHFSLDTSDGQRHEVHACLNSSSSRAGPKSRVNILRGEDGWHEYEVAEFSVPAAAHGQDEFEVAFAMWEHAENWKRGLYVHSVVLRPRQALSSSTGMRSSRPPKPSLPDGTM